MFGLGITELLLIIFVCVIFIRPDDFPSVITTIGKLYGKWQRLYYTAINDLYALAPTDAKDSKPTSPKETVKREKE